MIQNLNSVFEGARQILFELRKYPAGGKLFVLEKPMMLPKDGSRRQSPICE